MAADKTKTEYDLVTILAEVERRTETFTDTEWELLAQWCAKWVMRQVAILDPRWDRLINAARIETHREDWQLLGSWVARVLENGTHLSAPDHPYFAAGIGKTTETDCTVCGTRFHPEFPGQKICSNACGNKAFKNRAA